MRHFRLTISLQEDLILSEKAASQGGHQSLDYIPGASLLGACAGKLYSQLSTKDAFTVFHSGKVRFGNGYPLSQNGKIGLPVPFSYHYNKGEKYIRPVDHHRSQLQNITNTITDKEITAVQQKQLRTGYITDNLELLRPSRTLRMKTAINPQTARAATSQLFGYQAIEAGQKFIADLYFDDLEKNLCKQVVSALVGDHFLGRSRSAQYGSVSCQAEEVTEPSGIQEQSQVHGKAFFWCIADLALAEANGHPLTGAELTDFVWENTVVKIDYQSSYIRYRRYSSFNNKRRMFDLEKQVIEKGSVLSVHFDPPIPEEQLRKIEAKGIGLYRECGLGQIKINHPLICDPFPKDLETLSSVNEGSPAVPDHPLAVYLQEKCSLGQDKRNNQKRADQLGAELRGLYKSARAYAATDNNLVGPGASQWSRVAEAGRNYPKDKEKLLKQLFGEQGGHGLQNVVCKENDEAWGVETGNKTTFREWLYQALKDPASRQPGNVASQLARIASRMIKEQEGRRRDT